MQAFRRTRWLLLAACLVGLGWQSAATLASDRDQYWSWGWGLYSLRGQRDPLDSARYDWTYLLFGNADPPNRETFQHANEVLKINPAHRFVLQLWPILHLGDCAENSYQATLFHYLYVPGVREKILDRVRNQIEVALSSIDRPENIVGATFLEELPGAFTSAAFGEAFRDWKKGDPLPWDLARFEHEITRELGSRFELNNARHRRWWGEKYVRVINEIQRTMKKSLDGRPVLYYRHPLVRTLDEANALRGTAAAGSDPALMPISFVQVVGPGGADGLFGYPSQRAGWESQTKIIRKLKGLTFGQISLPRTMRVLSVSEVTELARWRYGGNLGSFVFPTISAPSRERAYDDAVYRSWTELVRRFAWDNRINLDIVDRTLKPQVRLEYARGARRFELRAQLWNPRDPSWFGGDYQRAVLHDVELRPVLPEGYQLDSPAEVSLGDVPPQDGRSATWSVIESKTGSQVPIAIDVISRESGTFTVGASSSTPALPGPLSIHVSGRRWLEGPMPTRSVAVAELRAPQEEIDRPLLARIGVERALYNDVLRTSERLVIGPGARARLFPVQIFNEVARTFAQARQGDSAVFNEGYRVYQAVGPSVRSGEGYRIRLRGAVAEGGNLLVLAQFTGVENGARVTKDVPMFVNALGTEERTVEAPDVTVPLFDDGHAQLSLAFYRLRSVGTLRLAWFDAVRTDLPPSGTDVSSMLIGSLPMLERRATTWAYFDRSHPGDGREPEVRVRVLSKDAAREEGLIPY